MLATKLLPEQDAENEAFFADMAVAAGAKACIQATAELSALIASLTQHGGPLDPKGPARVNILTAVKEASDTSLKSAGVDETGVPPMRTQLPSTAPPLEGGELLLAAACYGHGLS